MRKARAATGMPPGGRPKDDDRRTRKPLGIWDRIKFLILLGAIWIILVWSVMANDPLVGFSDAVRIEVRTGWGGVLPARPGAGPPDPLPDQRALGGLLPVLDLDGIRGRRAAHPPPDVGLDQVPPV